MKIRSNVLIIWCDSRVFEIYKDSRSSHISGIHKDSRSPPDVSICIFSIYDKKTLNYFDKINFFGRIDNNEVGLIYYIVFPFNFAKV